VLIGAGLALALLTAVGLSVSAGSSGADVVERSIPADAVLAGFVPPPVPKVELPPAPAAEEEPAPEPLRGEIRQGDTLAASFERAGAPRAAAFRVARWMKVQYDFRRRARPGHTWELVLDDADRVVDFRYRTSPLESYHLFLDADGRPVARKEEAELTPRITVLGGVVETTLYDAVQAQGEDPQLARDFADIFAWDLDFSRSVQPGDSFRILYERLYREEEDGEELYVRPGLILAARYTGSGGEHSAVYFEPQEGRGGYYRPDGTSVQGQFLKAPLRFTRISSRYSAARLHPILKVRRPHHGIDYAAPAGDPVWSVGDGQVIYRGWAGGFGNLVKVRHKNGYVSYYAHLSRFARGLRVGSQVQQKQVIGYVGQTGLATGPHVCFRISHDGHYVNPAELRARGGEPLPATTLPVFRDTRDLLLAELDAGPVLARDDTP
jgi:murein DD-endopeptidase MepM/ murein hydrolase activator NlpD